MNNKLIIANMNKLELYDLETDECFKLADLIVNNININQLRKSIQKASLNLSSVTKPCFGADLKYIALDNQTRLEIIWNLLNSFELFEKDIKNIRKNKIDYYDYDYIFQFLLNTQKLMKSVYEYGEFKILEKVENEKQLKAYENRMLKGKF